MGFGIVTDYKIDQLGLQYDYHGAIQVEGNWYCPSMPELLITATLDFRNKRITFEEWKARIANRTPYLLRRKEKPDAHGRTPMMCPAAGPNATVTCPLKELGRCSGKLPKNPKALLPILNPPQGNKIDKDCSNATSLSIPAVEGAKFAQELQYGTEAWQRMYSTARNIVETKNSQLKDENREGLASPGRRRLRGYAKQYFLLAVLVFNNNMRRYNEYLADGNDVEATDPQPPKNSVHQFAPSEPEWWSSVDAPAAQDPPLAA